MDVRGTVTAEEGDRYPLKPPNNNARSTGMDSYMYKLWNYDFTRNDSVYVQYAFHTHRSLIGHFKPMRLLGFIDLVGKINANATNGYSASVSTKNVRR
jgi:hypothetical protein